MHCVKYVIVVIALCGHDGIKAISINAEGKTLLYEQKGLIRAHPFVLNVMSVIVAGH
jgi:hypothetical protein